MIFHSLPVSCDKPTNKQQHFIETPEPQVQVIEGGLVTLKCRIGRQQGLVQWSKDGLMLGKFPFRLDIN